MLQVKMGGASSVPTKNRENRDTSAETFPPVDRSQTAQSTSEERFKTVEEIPDDLSLEKFETVQSIPEDFDKFETVQSIPEDFNEFETAQSMCNFNS